MSKISISIAEPCRSIDAIKLVRDVTGMSVGAVQKLLSTGKSGFFFTAELFLNDHVEVDRNIRHLVDGLKKLGLPIFVAELLYSESWADVTDLDEINISADDLIAVLDNARGGFS